MHELAAHETMASDVQRALSSPTAQDACLHCLLCWQLQTTDVALEQAAASYECLCFISSRSRCLGDYAFSALFSAYRHGWCRYDGVNIYHVPQALVFMFRATANNTADVDVHVEVKQARKGQRNRIHQTSPIPIQIKQHRRSFLKSSPVYVNHHCSLNREQQEVAPTTSTVRSEFFKPCQDSQEMAFCLNEGECFIIETVAGVHRHC
ncbi:hypothetical protein QQF64_004874, partial [Cirrhinus molitorella]